MTRTIAFFLSAVAASYSVMGLMAIFPAAKVAVVIMALTLECAKVMAAVWLRADWNNLRAWIRVYLISAVVTLMLVTSVGIYGFLAKAHVDAQVTQIDANEGASIATANLDGRKAAVDNLKAQIDEINKSIPHSEAWVRSHPTTVARSQKRLAELQAELVAAETALTTSRVNSIRQSVEAQRVEADYGPLRFISTAVYGDASKMHLDATVRWLIFVLMMVFDPLAITLWIASTGSRAVNVKVAFRDSKGRYLRSPKGRFASTTPTYR